MSILTIIKAGKKIYKNKDKNRFLYVKISIIFEKLIQLNIKLIF